MSLQADSSSESFGKYRDHAYDATAMFSNLNLSSNEASAFGDTGVRLDNRSRWEHGSPDYTGQDSFDNILKKIDSTMSTPTGESPKGNRTLKRKNVY